MKNDSELDLRKKYDEYLEKVYQDNIYVYEDTIEKIEYMTSDEIRRLILENEALSFEKWKKENYENN